MNQIIDKELFFLKHSSVYFCGNSSGLIFSRRMKDGSSPKFSIIPKGQSNQNKISGINLFISLVWLY